VKRRSVIVIAAVAIIALMAVAAISLGAVHTKSTPSLTGQKPTAPSIGAADTQNGKASSIILVTIPKDSSTVKFGQRVFNPDPALIKIGDTVKWRNSDTVDHTITHGTSSKDPQSGKLFDSGTLKPGKTFEFKFTKAAIYDYYCALHPAMAGQVIVK
jgi:plastocyanin